MHTDQPELLAFRFIRPSLRAQFAVANTSVGDIVPQGHPVPSMCAVPPSPLPLNVPFAILLTILSIVYLTCIYEHLDQKE